MNDNRNDLLAYLVDLASLGVGLQNLQENREQSEQNDVQAANDRQTAFLLAELKAEFEKQNEKLDSIIELCLKSAYDMCSGKPVYSMRADAGKPKGVPIEIRDMCGADFNNNEV